MATIESIARPGESSIASFRLIEQVELQHEFWKYFDLFRHAPYAFLLDSASNTAGLGQFSFMGGSPHLVVRARRSLQGPTGSGIIERIERKDAKEQRSACKSTNLLADLRRILKEQRPAGPMLQCPVPFTGGAVGYFAYETGQLIEQVPTTGRDDLGLPDLYFMFSDAVLCHCHATGRSFLSIVGRGKSEETARRRATGTADRLVDRIRQFECAGAQDWKGPSEPASIDGIDVHADLDEKSYCAAVESIKDRICAGDIYQACMTHRLETPLYGGSTWNLYRELRRINPAPFAGFLKFPEVQVLSSSPERFLRVGIDRVAESRPIKGTRPRGLTPEQDAALRDELQRSVKDLAENIMIVDLVRNDFGRVCEFGSVQVPELRAVQAHPSVFQMVSTIRGRLVDRVDSLDLIKACFPGGSMTGAPKIEAMKIIDQIEPVSRGIYSGAIGYLDYAGPVDLNIVIRSFVVKDGTCYYHAGGAVVADSDPRAEYLEAMDKARALQQALANIKATASEA